MSEEEGSEEDLEERVSRLEEKLDEELTEIESKLDKIWEEIGIASDQREKLTPKQERIYNEFIVDQAEGLRVKDLAEERDTSYNGAYKMLETLKEKGYVKEEREERGNGKKYIPKIK